MGMSLIPIFGVFEMFGHSKDVLASIKRHINDLNRCKGVIESLSKETSPIALDHFLKSLLGWHQRLNYSYWGVVESLTDLCSDIEEGNNNAAKNV